MEIEGKLSNKTTHVNLNSDPVNRNSRLPDKLIKALNLQLESIYFTIS
jgi:hypothetical protein